MGEPQYGRNRDFHPWQTVGRIRFRLVGMDISLLVLAVLLATCLRYDFHFETVSVLRLVIVLASGAGALVGLGGVQGLYTGRWLRGSFEEARAVSIAAVSVTAVMVLLDLALGHPVPASATLAAGPTALAGMAGVRMLNRVASTRADVGEAARWRVVVFGAGDAGKDVMGAMRRDPSRTYDPVALLDDDPAKSNLRLHGVAVRGNRSDLETVARRARADTLLIAVPSADGALMRALTDQACALGLTVKVLPPVSEFFDQVAGVEDIRPVTFADLMGRREIEVDIDAIAGYLTGRRVLVTGAGGSIGSELCRQVRRFGPRSLVMVDRDESALHALQMSMDGRALLNERCLVVADIRDRHRLERVLAEHAPEVIFHAAALKHLPLLEMHPEEAVKTNVFGTENMLAAAAATGVSRFVNISTDKAADPICVLGYSKRIAERLTAWYDLYATHPGSSYISVRFGNVLGSRGSVLTAFRQQIIERRPLTVTHPDVTRYFMTVEEAVRLVIQAGAVGSGGDVLVLDMGDPVRIADVAQRLILESGEDIAIEYTGLRPGEKLHECLLGEGEDDHRPIHPRISHAPVPPLPPADLGAMQDLHRHDEVIGRIRTATFAPVCLPGTNGGSFAARLPEHQHAEPSIKGDLRRGEIVDQAVGMGVLTEGA
jgi:FlaA1/EpsC-like NDP-sugar epimerase